MDENERFLLENALDAHDRLWDWQSSVVDVWALYAATAAALHATPHRAAFESAVATLTALVQSGLSPNEQRNRACGSTDDLRQYLARRLEWADAGVAMSVESGHPTDSASG